MTSKQYGGNLVHELDWLNDAGCKLNWKRKESNSVVKFNADLMGESD